MSISIVKRNSNPLDISINKKGEKLIYTTNPPKEPPQIQLSSSTKKEETEDNQTKDTKSPIKTVKSGPLPPQNENKFPKRSHTQSSQNYSSTKSQKYKTQQYNQTKTDDSAKYESNYQKDQFHFKPQNQPKEWKNPPPKQPITIPNNENPKPEAENQQDSLSEEEIKFLSKFKKDFEPDQQKPDKKTKNDKTQNQQKPKKYNIQNQGQFIDKSQKLIDNISSKTSFEFTQEIKDQLDALKDMIDTMISFDDSLLKESKIFISIINLFSNDLIDTTSKFNDIYSIFIDENKLIICPKLYCYFDSNFNQDNRLTIIKFMNKIFQAYTNIREEIFNFFREILNSKEINLSNEIIDLVHREIDDLENEIVLNMDKKQFIFNNHTINPNLKIEDLTNNYKNPWQSIESYIKVMYNLTTENFFYSFRQHLKELKNDELDPRDLNLYEKVKIVPQYTFVDRFESDYFIHFQLRAPNYKEKGQIKSHTLRTIDWQFTDRLSNRRLLLFSLSPMMETIECVAISKAKKGTIQNNIIPITILQGTLQFDQEYYMFEPIDHWNGPLYNNLLNTSELTLPKSLIKPIISLDFSENLIKNDDFVFNVFELFKNKGDNLFLDYEIESTDPDVQYYCQKIISILKSPTTKKDAFLRNLINNLPYNLKKLENERGNNDIQLNDDSEIVKKVSNEIKKMNGYKSASKSWIFDNFTPEDFSMNCVVDHEQFGPIKYALNHHFTLVNGAPGTGKTYLACELFKFLILSNYQYPILVVTYKNVSLDGFLTNIVDFLMKKNVDFIRIGGKPRTENKFILDRQYDQIIPADIQKIKGQIMFLTSLKINIKDCFDQLQNKTFSQSTKTIISELDKCICVRRLMFDMFPFYSKNEEIIITNFLEPVSCIPQAEEYLNCWVSDHIYYDNLKARLHRELIQKYNSILKIFNDYLKDKIDDKNDDDVINEIIENHFQGNEKHFYDFIYDNRRRVYSKDYTIFDDILYECHNYDPDASNPIHEANSLKNYLFLANTEMVPNKVHELIKQKFIRILSSTDKVNSFKSYLNELMPILTKHIRILRDKCSDKQKEFKKKEIKEMGDILKTKSLIAMTATRAAQYKESLDRAHIRFMIVEEAGELTEPMAFSIIPKSTQNLIMIGDYRQLRPTVEHNLTFPPYNHHISLFEKEVLHAKSIKSDNLFTLSIQRRMHPQISELLRHVFYNNNKDEEKLNDDESTFKIEKPIGFPNHIQFWLHNFEEEMENIKMRSHVNAKEAQVCAYLFMLMLCRGYKSSEITIVSLYKGQKRQIEKELVKIIDKYYENENMSIYDAFDFENDWSDLDEPPRNLDELIEFRKSLVGRYVKCLDDFQGEENEVIIISLTRSEKPGFVKNTNRALVTLSRAKQMEFVVGNKNVFGYQNKMNPLWQKITAEAVILDENVMHSDGISVCCCQLHNKSENKTMILTKPSHFFDCRFNCCKENCPCLCDCGHPCKLPCHFHNEIMSNRQNLYQVFVRRYFCNERCEKKCQKDHQCDDMCGNCSHFGCPDCSHKCESRCSLCSKRCPLNCCHPGVCQCQFSGVCTKCRSKINCLHGDVKLLNGRELVCNNCYKKFTE